MLQILVLIPILGSIVIATIPITHTSVKRLGLFVSLVTFWLTIYLYAGFDQSIIGLQGQSFDPLSLNFAIDGISLPFIILTGFLTPIVLLAS